MLKNPLFSQNPFSCFAKAENLCYNVDMRIFTYLKNGISKFFYRNRCRSLNLTFPLVCKAHGVKTAVNQGAIAQSKSGDKLQLVHVPQENYPHNVYVYSIPLNRILGYLNEGLCKKLVKLFGKGFCTDGVIEKITGDNHTLRGCNLRIYDTREMMADVDDFSHLHNA